MFENKIKYIYIKNKRYYLYRIYENGKKAKKTANKIKKEKKCKYFILTQEKDMIIKPELRYHLYFDKILRIQL